MQHLEEKKVKKMSLSENILPSEEAFYVSYVNVKKIFYSPEDFFVLLDGFALMFEICQNKHLKWSKNGGVYLHFIYLVERYLNMFLKIKKFIKIVFFSQFSKLLNEHDPDLHLTYQLMIFHLKNLPIIKDNLMFYDDLNSYSADIKEERCVGFIGFSYNDLILGNAKLRTELKLHLLRIIGCNLNIGLVVMLTNNFWYDTDCASALTLSKRKFTTRFKIQAEDKNGFRIKNDDFGLTFENLSRSGLYLEATKDLEFRNLFILHLYLLETIPLENRKINTQLYDFKEEFPNVFKSILKFKQKSLVY